jgi:hypothetical protein
MTVAARPVFDALRKADTARAVEAADQVEQ